MINLLPKESFVEFDASELSNPSLIWSNDEMSCDDNYLAYAYCKRFPEEPDYAYRKGTRSFLGDRYGGPGVGGNSGGVRCGLAGNIQIKGIGSNQLAGMTTDYWHKHGASSLQDCVRESIWGEITESALPYGAVRALAIIATGTAFDGEVADTKKKTAVPRALLLREPSLRPAHYMRSIFCSPGPLMLDECSDVVRTTQAVKMFGRLRPLFATVQGESTTQMGDLAYMLDEIFKRAAHQIAASRAKRLMHGSLIPSNYTVDGKWLDFGTITALGDFGRAIVAPGGKDLWSQHEQINEAIVDLRFYLSKYLPPEQQPSLPSTQLMIVNFQNHFKRFLNTEFLKLTGIPECWLNEISERRKARLSEMLISFAASGNMTPYLYFGDDRHSMPTCTGRNSLTDIMRKSAVSDSPRQLDQLLEGILQPSERTEYVESYWFIRNEAVARASHFACPVAQLSLTLQGLRRNWDLEPLYRHNFDRSVDSITKTPARVKEFIATSLAYWRGIFAESAHRHTSLSPWLTSRDVSISNRLEIYMADRPASASDLLDLVNSFSLPDIEKHLLRSRFA